MLASLIRTVVPLLVAGVGPILTGWLGWTPDDVSRVATLLVAGGYYLVVRLAERYIAPQFGWLLGLAGAPQYQATSARRPDTTSSNARWDGGWSRIGLLAAVAAALLVAACAVVVVMSPAQASPDHRPDRSTSASASSALSVEMVVTSTEVCSGTLVVTFAGTLHVGGAAAGYPILDAGLAKLDAYEPSGRSWPRGQWVPLTRVVSGGDRVLRWPGWQDSTTHGSHWTRVRVRDAGTVSAPVAITQACVA